MTGMSGNAAASVPATARLGTLLGGGCCGYRVQTAVSFGCLRPGSGSPLRIVEADDPGLPGEPVMSWPAHPEYPHAIYLSRTGPRYMLRVNDLGWFEIDPTHASMRISASSKPLRREVGLWGIPAALCAIHQGDRPIHAAAVEVRGGAVLLAAPGHFGKTTLAAAFLRAGHRVLSEDLSYCRSSLMPAVLPGPALLRVREDVFEGLGVQGATIALRSMGRVFLVLDDDRRGSSRPVPLQAIVLLRRATQGIRAVRVPALEALRDLWALTFKLPDDADRSACFQSLSQITEHVPVWNLYRPLGLGQLQRTVETIAALCCVGP